MISDAGLFVYSFYNKVKIGMMLTICLLINMFYYDYVLLCLEFIVWYYYFQL